MFEIQRKVMSSPCEEMGVVEMKLRPRTTSFSAPNHTGSSEMGLRQSARGGIADADGRRVNPYNYARNVSTYRPRAAAPTSVHYFSSMCDPGGGGGGKVIDSRLCLKLKFPFVSACFVSRLLTIDTRTSSSA